MPSYSIGYQAIMSGLGLEKNAGRAGRFLDDTLFAAFSGGIAGGLGGLAQGALLEDEDPLSAMGRGAASMAIAQPVWWHLLSAVNKVASEKTAASNARYLIEDALAGLLGGGLAGAGAGAVESQLFDRDIEEAMKRQAATHGIIGGVTSPFFGAMIRAL